MKRTVIPELKRESIHRLAQRGCREDDRSPDSFRDIRFKVSPVGTAEGSVRLWLGKTEVLAGVKMQVGEPYPDKPDQGVLMTGCELKPMAHPGFEGGAPSDDSVEIARVVDRGIRESGMVDIRRLCIEPGKKAWLLFIDIQALNYDGNLFDAATMAAVLALHNTTVPASRFGLGDDFRLPVSGWPLTATVVKMKDVLMADPTHAEELVAEARLTISLDEEGSVRAMQKGLRGALTYDEVGRAMELALKLTAGIREMLKKGD